MKGLHLVKYTVATYFTRPHERQNHQNVAVVLSTWAVSFSLRRTPQLTSMVGTILAINFRNYQISYNPHIFEVVSAHDDQVKVHL